MSQVADSQLQKVVLNVKFGTFQWLFLFRASNHLAWVHSIRVVHQDIDLVLCLTVCRALRYLRQRPGFTSHEPRKFRNFHQITELRYIWFIFIYFPPKKAPTGEYHHKMKVSTPQILKRQYPHLLKPPENHRGWGFATMTIGRDDQMPETLQGHRAMNTKL